LLTDADVTPPLPVARAPCAEWKGAVFVGGVTLLGIYMPYFCMSFAQRKAGVWES
jgi:formate-dependent nitrite reductase membrane component NrfD